MPAPKSTAKRVSVKKRVRKNRVLSILREEGAMSRFDIAKATEYSPPVVTKLVGELIRDGFVRERGKGKSIGGRRPIMVDLVPESSYIIGIDIGQHQVVGLLMDMTATVLETIKGPTFLSDSPDRVAQQLQELICDLIGPNAPRMQRLQSIGLAFPSARGNGAADSASPPWRPVAKRLNQKFGVPVHFDNDACLMALGEKWFGGGRGHTHFMTVNMGYGVGSGIIFNNELYHGGYGHAGELGHVKFNTLDRPCLCGGKGCLESVAGGWAIERQGHELLARNGGSILQQMTGGNAKRIDPKLMAEAARRGDIGCRRVFAEAGRYTGLAIAAAANLLNPEVVIIGGQIANAADLFLDELRQEVDAQALGATQPGFKIEISALRERASALGACAVVLENLFQSPYEEVLRLV